MQIILSLSAILKNLQLHLLSCSFSVLLFGSEKKKKKKKGLPQAGASLEHINFWTRDVNLLKVANIESKAREVRSASWL